MKTIVTVIASVLLSLGMLAAPAHAEEVTAPPCEETAQEWRARALAAEADLAQTSTTLSAMVDQYLIQSANVEQANKSVERLAKVTNRQRVKIAELRKMLRQARRN